MALGEWLSRVGNNIGDNVSNAPPDAWFSLAHALANSRNVGEGLAHGIAGFGEAAQAARKKSSLADALKGMSGDYTPQQQMLLTNYPELALPQLAENAFKAPKGAEKPSGVQEYEYAKSQGYGGSFMDFETSKRKAGAPNTTINNIPAEVGARVALGEGFLSDFDRIKDTAKKFYGGGVGEQVKRRVQMVFNTGEGGKLWRDVEVGKEALVRNLTGQGMSVSEAEGQAARYALSPLDTEYDALTKLDGLRRDLENVARGAYGAKGGKYTPPASGGTNNYQDVDELLGLPSGPAGGPLLDGPPTMQQESFVAPDDMQLMQGGGTASMAANGLGMAQPETLAQIGRRGPTALSPQMADIEHARGGIQSNVLANEGQYKAIIKRVMDGWNKDKARVMASPEYKFLEQTGILPLLNLGG